MNNQHARLFADMVYTCSHVISQLTFFSSFSVTAMIWEKMLNIFFIYLFSYLDHFSFSAIMYIIWRAFIIHFLLLRILQKAMWLFYPHLIFFFVLCLPRFLRIFFSISYYPYIFILLTTHHFLSLPHNKLVHHLVAFR